MADKPVDAAPMRAGMHEAVDVLINVLEACPPEVLAEIQDDEDSVTVSLYEVKSHPLFQDTLLDYDQNTLYHSLAAIEERNQQWTKINEEGKDALARDIETWNAAVAAGQPQPFPCPRPLPVIDSRNRAGYHLLDENGGSLQELFRENLY